MKNVTKSLAKSLLTPLRLTAASSAIDADIQMEMNYIMQTVKSIKRSGSLTKGVSETIKNDAKQRK